MVMNMTLSNTIKTRTKAVIIILFHLFNINNFFKNTK